MRHPKTHLSRKRVALDAVLGAELVVQSIVNVDLVESIAIRKWAASEVDWRLWTVEHIGRFVVGRKYDAVAGVGDSAAYLLEIGIRRINIARE